MFGYIHSQAKFDIVLHFIKKAEESNVLDAPAYKKFCLFSDLVLFFNHKSYLCALFLNFQLRLQLSRPAWPALLQEDLSPKNLRRFFALTQF